jgi:hypothetical protein
VRITCITQFSVAQRKAKLFAAVTVITSVILKYSTRDQPGPSEKEKKKRNETKRDERKEMRREISRHADCVGEGYLRTMEIRDVMSCRLL